MAAQKLGETQVPTIELSHLTKIQKQAYIIADNKLALNANWDENLLQLEIQDLKAVNFDLSLLGFSPYELINGKSINDGEHEEKEDEEQPADINFTIQYNIIFDHEEQQADWYNFIKSLKDQYPNAETVAERLQLFLRGNGYVTR